MVRRLFVEKKDGFNVEASNLLADLKDSLGIKGINELRLVCRYDVEGLSDEQFKVASHTILSEPNVDIIYFEEINFSQEFRVFATEYLPGQYDQRADSAAQCVQLLTQKERPKVISARIIAIGGDISEDEFEKIKKYVVNPVESRVASFAKPDKLEVEVTYPADIAVVSGFIGMRDEQIADYHASMGFAMTCNDLAFCRDYFKLEGRDPFVTELRVIDTYWSDHCRHTTFSTELESIEIEKGEISVVIEDALEKYFEARHEVYGQRDKKVTLMDMATMGVRLLKKRGMIPDLDESQEINACSIEVPVTIDGKTEQWLIQFKNETHNHPTEIEPFGGAATCLGGAIRDPLSGRAYVYQAMRVTGAADPTVSFEKTIEAKLPQKKITTGAAAGYSSYGNQIGIATGQVTELYHDGYAAKRMEIGAVVGASPKENVKRFIPELGDVIVLLGGRTGRDGCGGATGSSKAHDSSSIEACSAEVQKGNPPTERKLQRLFRNKSAAAMIKRCNDFGAGGVCVAIGELADSLKIDLDKVPKKYEGLDGTELAISESQERMAVVLAPSDVENFCAIAKDENLEATVVATVTDNGKLIMSWRDKIIVELKREFLNTNGVTGTAKAVVSASKLDNDYRHVIPECLKGKKLKDAFLCNLERLNVCCNKGLAERFDASIGAATVLMPFAGENQLTPEEAMVAKISLEHGETDDATAFSYGFIPGISDFSPFHSAAWAIMESLSKLAAVGAPTDSARLTFQEYFERLRDDSTRWGKPVAALLGAFIAQREMGVPSIGGKDSMSGSFNDIDVPPTLVSFAISLTKASVTGSAALEKKNSKILLVRIPENQQTHMPDFAACKRLYELITTAVRQKKIIACSVVKEGGAAGAVAKMAFGNNVGIHFETNNAQTLFAPYSASFVVQTDCEKMFSEFDTTIIATTNDSDKFVIDGEEILQSTAKKAWMNRLEGVFPICSSLPVKTTPNILEFSVKSSHSPAIKIAKPKVFIPVFPGTNCEIDTARAFEKAGAQAEILVIRNLTPADIEESINAMVKAINSAQIIMLPGGFSGGDEPDGSGKFIATTFRGALLKDATERLLYERDGLMLGICNGFQALIKLGLVPFGNICDPKSDAPTLTFNTLGRHISRMVYTKVVSNKSPWLAGCKAGDIHTVPISHGEGRFVANDATLKELIAGGQVATQYVDLSGNITDDIDFNPNGSVCAIEGITSFDGRVFGKMGHSERKGENLYKNVPGEKDQHIFESGVKYFK